MYIYKVSFSMSFPAKIYQHVCGNHVSAVVKSIKNVDMLDHKPFYWRTVEFGIWNFICIHNLFPLLQIFFF